MTSFVSILKNFWKSEFLARLLSEFCVSNAAGSPIFNQGMHFDLLHRSFASEPTGKDLLWNWFSCDYSQSWCVIPAACFLIQINIPERHMWKHNNSALSLHYWLLIEKFTLSNVLKRAFKIHVHVYILVYSILHY